MYLACFKILTEFVEKERPDIGLGSIDEYYIGWKPTKVDRKVIGTQFADEQEIRALYDWWKTGRKAEHDACEHLLDGVDRSFDRCFVDRPDGLVEYVSDPDPRWDAYLAEDRRLDEKDEEMLTRLMKVRGWLWT
jgi:hypothetical protein